MVTNNPIPAKGGSLFGSTTINWEDVYKGNNVMWRVPRNVRLNDNVVVREDETAVFFRDGKVLAYLDKPDRYALTSLNAPLVGNIVKALSGVRQEAEVYYLQRRIFDGKFGSSEPYVFKDPDFGLVQLRVFGSYRWNVGSPDNFITQFVGTFGAATTADVEGRLRDQMVLLVYNTLGKLKDQGMHVTDLATQLDTIEQAVLGFAPQHFEPLGIEVKQLQGISVNLPDEVQKAVNTRSTMGVLGVNYMQYQAGQALTTAAANPSGSAGTMVGAGVGLGAGARNGLRHDRSDVRSVPRGAEHSVPQVFDPGPVRDSVLPQLREPDDRTRPGGARPSVSQVRHSQRGGHQVLLELRRVVGPARSPDVPEVWQRRRHGKVLPELRGHSLISWGHPKGLGFGRGYRTWPSA